MSMRPPVDRERIEQFLRRLDHEYHGSGRIYLAGGAALVHAGMRGRTLDIDLFLGSDDPGELTVVIRRLTHEMQINVELASPGDFIPLPPGWNDRSQWIGRYGKLDVFYFDFYSIALSKIARANERDIDDVVQLVRQGFVTPDDLESAYEAIKPQLGVGKFFNIDPDIFATNYAAVRSRWEQSSAQ